MKHIPKKITNGFTDLSLEVIEQVPSILTSPDLLTNPHGVIIRAGAALITKKFSKLARDYQQARDLGQIKDLESEKVSEKNIESLLDLMKTIDNGVDEEQFRAMKSIFFCSISMDGTQKEEAEAYTLMQVCKRLTGQQILILSKLYQYTKNSGEGFFKIDHIASEWFIKLCDDLSMVDPIIVRKNFKNLEEEALVSVYLGSSQGPSIFASTLLTPLGSRLSEYITRY